MFGGIYFGQAYFGQPYPVPGILFDNATNSGYKASLSTYSFTHVVGLDLRGLLVNVSIFATGTVSSITYNGVNLAFVRADSSGVYRNEIWKLEAPAYGSHTVTVNLSASLTSIASASSYANVDQTNMVDGSTGATGTGGTPTLSSTTVADQSWVMSGITTSDTTVSPASSQTQRDNNSGALGSGGLADIGPISPPASTAVNWSAVGISDTWVLGAVDIKPTNRPSNYHSPQNGTLNFAGSLTRQNNYILSATLSFAGALTKLLSRALSGTSSFVGSVTKKTNRIVSGILSFSGLLLTLLAKIFTATLSFTGSFNKSTIRPLSSTLSFSGSITRKITKAVFTASLKFITNFIHSALTEATGTLWKENTGFLTGAVKYDDSNTLFDAAIPFDGSVTANITRVYPQAAVLWTPPIYASAKTIWRQNNTFLQNSIAYDDSNTLFDAVVPFDGTNNLSPNYPTPDTIWREPSYL